MPYQFNYPVTRVFNGYDCLETDHKGDLEIEFVVSKPCGPEIDFNYIKWNGTDIFTLLASMASLQEGLDEIKEAAKNHLSYIHSQKQTA